jgi:hypothetical protein
VGDRRREKKRYFRVLVHSTVHDLAGGVANLVEDMREIADKLSAKCGRGLDW